MGATLGDVQMSSISVIAIVGSVRRTLTKGAMKRRNLSLSALSDMQKTETAKAINHEYSVRSIVLPKARQKSASIRFRPMPAIVSAKEGII